MIQTPGFALPVDICNRALHHVGADHELITIQDTTKPGRLVRNVYHKLRKAELRRNPWTFAIRHSVLRPMDTTSVQWTPPTYNSASAYSTGQVVQYDDGLGSRLYIANTANGVGVAPGTDGWDDYTGTLVAPLWVSGTTYDTGELVYKGTYTVYLALMQTTDDPAASVNWVSVGTVAKIINIMYPLSAGPVSQVETLNAFPIPYAYLRKIKQDPSAGVVSVVGAPSNAMVSDWVVENGYIITRETDAVIPLRFVADVSNVARMDAMFCEGLAARIAAEIAEPLTQSTEKLKTISSIYQKAITEARLINSIEDGADAPELDDFIACRV